MDRSPTTGGGRSTELIVEIVETLEACGLDRGTYQLYDHVDIEALEKLLASTSGDTEVRFTIEGIRVTVTSDAVNVLLGESASVSEP